MSVTSHSALEPREPEMTLEEWANMDEDEPGELVDGRLVEEEVPTFRHESAVSWFLVRLGVWGERTGARVYPSEAKFAVAPRRGRKPDLSVYFRERDQPKADDALGRVPPSIMVEVVSGRRRDVRRDRVDKLVEYARFGVSYYWLLDPRNRTFEIFELGSDRRYTLALSASAGTHAIPGCEGLGLDLDELWRTLDALPK